MKFAKFKFKHPLVITAGGLGLFLIGLVFLITSAQAVQMTQTQLVNAGNLAFEKPKFLVPEVAGAEKKVVTVVVNGGITAPKFTANAVLAQDLETGKLLFQKNIGQKMSPASTTKIMTALVAQDYFKSADVLTVPPEAMVGGSSMGLSSGESISYRNVLYGMLLNSGNDAAYTIALNYPGGFSNFVAKMNEKAQALNLTSTHFENPAGFDSPNHYSAASDLAQIAIQVIKDPQLARA